MTNFPNWKQRLIDLKRERDNSNFGKPPPPVMTEAELDAAWLRFCEKWHLDPPPPTVLRMIQEGWKKKIARMK